MKQLLTIMATSVMIFAATGAMAQNALEDEMEDYARDFFRAHPKAAGDLRTREAREKLYQDTKREQILELSAEEEKQLRRRKDLIDKDSFTKALNDLKMLHSKNPAITFLIKYAENPRIKADQKLLAYRLIKKHYPVALEEASNTRGKQLHKILTLYNAYKANHNGKAPASLDDLELPDDCKQYTNAKGEKMDWIYIGHLGKRLTTDNSHIVIAAPEPLGTVRTCGLDNGEVARFKNSSISNHLEKLSAAGNHKGSSDADSTNTAPLIRVMKKYRIYKELYNNKEPTSINDLNLKKDDKQYTDPETGEKLDWIFLAKSSRLTVGGDVKVIIVTPKPYKKYRIAGLSNGKIIKLPESKIGPALKK